MILLDTNIVSEVMRPRPDVQVIDWPNQCAIATRNTKDFNRCGVRLINPFEP